MVTYGPDQFVCVMYYGTAGYSCPEHNQRASYYSMTGTPTAVFDGYRQYIGGQASGSMYNAYLPIVQEHLTRPSAVQMSLDMNIAGGTITVNGTIEALGAVVPCHVYIVVYEEPADRSPHLARGFPVWQENLTALSSGQTQNVSGTLAVGAGWNEANLHAIMFLQYLGNGTMIVAGPGPGPDNVNEAVGYHLDGGWYADVQIQAYGPDRYGVNVATGDVNGDSFDEILTGPGPGAVFGPQVRGFGYDGNQLSGLNFLAYGTNKYGANVCAADLDGDGYDEIVTGAGPGAVFGPHVRGWNYDGSGTVTSIGGISFFAYGTPKWGVNVCGGDVDGDGYDEIITGAGPGAVYGPHVRGWNYDNNSISAMSTVSFLAYGTNKFGVNVACGDIDGDGMAEIVTGAGPGAVFGPHVRGWNCDGSSTTSIGAISFFAFDYNEWGCNVGCGDIDGDGIDEIIVGAGPAPAYDAWVETYNFDGGTISIIEAFTAFDRPNRDITHGVNVAVGQF
jgi:hypothetical protein